MAIEDYLPNVFGSAAPTYLQGLLGAEETQKLQGRANVQGLLGAGLALAQGMSRVGPRRSAAENILGALTGGFGAAGGAYDQGIKNYVTQQQIAQTQLAQQDALLKRQQAQAKIDQIKAIEKEDPALARLLMINEAEGAKQLALKQQVSGLTGKTGAETPEALRSQAQGIYATGNAGLKPLADSLSEKADRLEVQQRLSGQQVPSATQAQPSQQIPQQVQLEPGLAVTPQGKTFSGVPNYSVGERYVDDAMHQKVLQQQTTLPGMTVTATPGPDAQLQQTKDLLLAQNASLSGVKNKFAIDAVKANNDMIASIDKQLDRFAVSGYDFDTVKKSVSDKFKPQIDAIKQLAETQALGADQVRIAIQEVFKQSQESERGQRIEGLPGEFAQMRFGTADRTKLTPDQARQVLLFADAPTADQSAQLQREAINTQFTTGRQAPVPAGRGMFLNDPGQRPVQQPVVSQQVAPQVVSPTPVVPTQTAQVRTQVPPQVTPQVVPQTQVTQTVARENAPAETKNLYSYNKNALINKSDRDYSPAKKQILLEKQAPLQSAVTYSLTSIKDARDAAQSLKNNPQYIDALTGRFSPLLLKGGSAVSQDIQTANELLQNLLTRSFVKEIQAMRAASPTGAAVGSVTEREMDALSKVSAALSVGMSKDEFIKQLDNYLAIANRSLKNIPTEYSKTYGYNGEFDEILTTPGVSTTRTSGKTPVQLELERREGGRQ
jgi:hypothetical protein